MKTETQNLIVIILGLYALISLIGIIILASFTVHDNELLFALVPITTTPVSILGGFVGGKSWAEKQEELYDEQMLEEEPSETCDNEEIEQEEYA